MQPGAEQVGGSSNGTLRQVPTESHCEVIRGVMPLICFCLLKKKGYK